MKLTQRWFALALVLPVLICAADEGTSTGDATPAPHAAGADSALAQFESSLNYDIRVLGRRGVLSLNAVAGMKQLQQIKSDMREVLSFTEFSAGHRYSEFNGSTDQVAAYGIAALVAGGVAAKMGLFAKLGILLLSLKKGLVFILAGAGALVAKLFKRGGSQS